MKNWKTTLMGFAVAAAQLFGGGMNWKNVLIAMGMAALGAVAKDAQVTGGTIVQPTPAPALAEKVVLDGASK